MENEAHVYRRLQRQIDTHPVGFPSTWSGADIRFLKGRFARDEARLAIHLTHEPTALDAIIARAGPEFSADEATRLLASMAAKGAIGWRRTDGVERWFLMPMVVGMFEGLGERLTPEALADADAYMRTPAFGISLLAASPSQMRTIPINKSIKAEHHVATYDQIREVAGESRGPFVVLACICRERKSLKGQACRQTSRLETCLGFGGTADHALHRGVGRAISRDEAQGILEQNERDGLVLQPANAQHPEFVCSCCGCCCGMLSMQKSLPHPVDFWTSNFYVEVDAQVCAHCGKCVSRCQVGAITRRDRKHAAVVNLSRCIGCGLCVTTCPSGAIHLRKKTPETVPPKTVDDLHDRIAAGRKTTWERWCMVARLMLRLRL